MSESSVNSSYQVFARKYRPRTFDGILGQDHVVQTLKNAISQNRLAHAYLFVGPRGTGKTSTARILAKALNGPGGPKVDFDPDDPLCVEIGEGNSLDVLEIDGASNNGVEQVRELRDTVKFAPSSGRYKIYYIDEVHMLTTQAFNALLKTLEEPPEHVKFIFATTEPQKILPTIISRCQRFDLRRIPANIISNHLLYIAKEENVKLSEAAAFAIAKGADGGMRDAQSMLDQLVAFCGESIEEADVLDIFGFNSAEAIAGIAGLILNRQSGPVLEQVYIQSESGKDLTKLLSDLITHYRHLLVTQVDPKADSGEIPSELRAILDTQKALISTGRLLHLIDLLAETDARMKWAPNKKLHLEIGFIKAIQSLGETSLDDVISMISDAADAAPADPATPVVSARAQQPVSPKGIERTPVVAESKPPPATQSISQEAPAEVAPSPKAEPKPEAPAAAAPVPAPTSSGPLEGDALWDAARQYLITERPLIHAWLESTRILQQNDRQCTIGFPVEQDFFRESLGRHKDLIQEVVSRLAGKPLEIRLEISDTLQPVEFEPEPSDEEDSAPDSDTAPPPGDNTSAPSNEPSEPEAEPKEDFYNDPLIRKALEEFDGTVLENS